MECWALPFAWIEGGRRSRLPTARGPRIQWRPEAGGNSTVCVRSGDEAGLGPANVRPVRPLKDEPAPRIGVVAIDEAGVLGERIDSPMWGPLVQCETLLRHNDVDVEYGSGRPFGEIVLTSSSTKSYTTDLPLLVVDYGGSDMYVLGDGRPREILLADRSIALAAHEDVVRAISRFLGLLGPTVRVPTGLSVSVEIEVLVGRVSTLIDRLERALDDLQSVRVENRDLQRQIDQLVAERNLLRTQIPAPTFKKVHWTASSLMLSLVAISSLLQGVSAARALSERDDPDIVVSALNQTIVQCDLVINSTVSEPND